MSYIEKNRCDSHNSVVVGVIRNSYRGNCKAKEFELSKRHNDDARERTKLGTSTLFEEQDQYETMQL